MEKSGKMLQSEVDINRWSCSSMKTSPHRRFKIHSKKVVGKELQKNDLNHNVHHYSSIQFTKRMTPTTVNHSFANESLRLLLNSQTVNPLLAYRIYQMRYCHKSCQVESKLLISPTKPQKATNWIERF